MHDFKKSLAVGHAGELLLLEHWPGLIRLDGRKADFVTATGTKIELKTDSYDMNSTPNFFIELLSDLARDKPGGPRQARLSGSDLFCYMYTKNKVLFTFEVPALCDWLDANENKYLPTRIPNKTWTTIGIKVPRIDLKGLYTERSLL